MTLDEAIIWMRSKPEYAGVVRDAYLGPDLADSAQRFTRSGEFAAVTALLGLERIAGACVLDLGAGTGIASYAFLSAGAKQVIAIEPDASEFIGRGALQRLCANQPVQILSDSAEKISLPDASVDLVYARQVLHHLRDLPAAMRECARVLRPKGMLLACREHVADDSEQLTHFLANHPTHRLAGGEHAFPVTAYRQAILDAGFRLQTELGPWDSVINAFPFVTDERELADYASQVLARKFGAAGRLAAQVPGIQALVWRWLRRPRPGRMHTFLAIKSSPP